MLDGVEFDDRPAVDGPDSDGLDSVRLDSDGLDSVRLDSVRPDRDARREARWGRTSGPRCGPVATRSRAWRGWSGAG